MRCITLIVLSAILNGCLLFVPYEADEDGDGFNTSDCVVEDVGSCPDEDCDDTDPDVNPDASEECDGIDNNCDGDIDEDCDTADTGE